MQTGVVETTVEEQYRRYPYPVRNPKHEHRRLVTTRLGGLDKVNGLLWGGRRRLDHLRLLDAGCGTGDSAIYMAWQAPRAKVVAVDRSATSLDIARRRAQARGARNITFVQASLLDLPALGLEPFDYVVCSGVLHHLPDPSAGLRALIDVLRPDGGLGIMVYGQLGREPIYQLQELLRRLTPGEDLDTKVQVAEQMLAQLSPRHLFKAANLEREFDDLTSAAGIVDLLLHARDRAYTVGEVHELLEGHGARLRAFDRPVFYRPESYPLTEDLRHRVAGMEARERQAIAELLNGRLSKHTFYATREAFAPTAPPAHSDPATICPVVYDLALAGYFTRLEPQPQPIHLESPEGFTITLELSAADATLLRGIDGRRTVAEIVADAAAVAGPSGSPENLLVGWRRLYENLEGVGYAGYYWAHR